MLDHLRVLAYGEAAPLKSLASVAVREGQTLVVTPFDPEACGPATLGPKILIPLRCTSHV